MVGREGKMNTWKKGVGGVLQSLAPLRQRKKMTISGMKKS